MQLSAASVNPISSRLWIYVLTSTSRVVQTYAERRLALELLQKAINKRIAAAKAAFMRRGELLRGNISKGLKNMIVKHLSGV